MKRLRSPCPVCGAPMRAGRCSTCDVDGTDRERTRALIEAEVRFRMAVFGRADVAVEEDAESVRVRFSPARLLAGFADAFVVAGGEEMRRDLGAILAFEKGRLVLRNVGDRRVTIEEDKDHA